MTRFLRDASLGMDLGAPSDYEERSTDLDINHIRNPGGVAREE